MAFLRVPLWPFQSGLISPTDVEQMARYLDIIRICNHPGQYFEGVRVKVWVPSGCCLVSERMLVNRWDSNRGKVSRFLAWAIEWKLFWTTADNTQGTWLAPHDPDCDPPNGPDGEPENEHKIDPANDPQNKILRWILGSNLNGEILGSRRGCGGTLREKEGQPSDFVDHPRVKYPPQLQTPEVREVLLEWVGYRINDICKPIKSYRAVQGVIREFQTYQPDQFIDAVQYCMGKEWEGCHRHLYEKAKAENDGKLIHFKGKPVQQKTTAEVAAEAEAIMRKGCHR